MRIVDDATGVELTPGKPEICAGNGQTRDNNGSIIECCCDQCDFLIDCTEAGQWEGSRQCEQ